MERHRPDRIYIARGWVKNEIYDRHTSRGGDLEDDIQNGAVNYWRPYKRVSVNFFDGRASVAVVKPADNSPDFLETVLNCNWGLDAIMGKLFGVCPGVVRVMEPPLEEYAGSRGLGIHQVLCSSFDV